MKSKILEINDIVLCDARETDENRYDVFKSGWQNIF